MTFVSYSGGTTMINFLWGLEGKTFMQLINFFFGVGGIIAPIATVPFLIDESKILSYSVGMNSSKSSGSTLQPPTTNNISYPIQSLDSNASYLDFNHVEKPESILYKAYLITAAMVVSAALPFLVFAIRGSSKTTKKNKLNTDIEHESRSTRKIPLAMKACLLVAVGLLLAMSCGAEDTFNSYLTSYCVKYFGWTKSNGSYAAVVYWIFFCVGRFIGICIIHIVNLSKLLFGFISFLVLSSIGFALCGYYKIDLGIWITSGCIGLGVSITFPTAVSWVEENLFPVTGKISAVMFIAASSAAVVNPIILGFLMEEVTPLWFPYLITIENTMLLVVFFICVVLAKYAEKKYGKNIVGLTDLELKVDSEIKEQTETFLDKHTPKQ